MCRVLAIHQIRENHGEPERDHVYLKKLVEFWKQASHYDPFLKKPLSFSTNPNKTLEHDDGWGFAMVNARVKEDKTQVLSQSYYTDLLPVRETPLGDIMKCFMSPSLDKGNSQAFIFHSRKASENTPKFLGQVHPMHITVSGKEDSIYVIHNGGLSVSVLFDKMSSTRDFTGGIEKGQFSDTQVFTWYIMNELQKRDPGFSIEEFWQQVLREIVVEHQKREKKYSMILFIIHKREEDFQLIGTKAVMPAYLEKVKEYYDLYMVRRQDLTAFMSSTAFMHLKEDPAFDGFEKQEIPNHSFFAVTSRGEFKRIEL